MICSSFAVGRLQIRGKLSEQLRLTSTAAKPSSFVQRRYLLTRFFSPHTALELCQIAHPSQNMASEFNVRFLKNEKTDLVEEMMKCCCKSFFDLKVQCVKF